MSERENSRLSFDHVPKELRPPRLKRGQIAKFRVHGTYDPVTKKGRLVTAMRIPYKDVILNEDGEDIQIELIDRIASNGDVKYMDLWITSQTSNILLLNGSRAKDRRVYEYLMMSNINAQNPNRDPSVPKLVEPIDEVENAKMRRSLKKLKREAIRMAEDMSEEEIRAYFKGKGAVERKDIYILREMVENDAETDPEAFMSKGVTSDKKLDTELRIASKKKVIRFDQEVSAWYFGDTEEKICDVPRGIGISRYEELANFITKNENGDEIFQTIQEALGD